MDVVGQPPRKGPLNARQVALGIATLIVLVGVAFAVLTPKEEDQAESTQAAEPAAAPSLLVPVAEREPLPAISGETNSGGSFSTDSINGEPYLVHVWASWCPTCAAEAPSLSKLLKANSDVKVVGINVEDSPADAKSFQSSNDLEFHADLKDEQRELQNQLGLTGQPNTLVVDADGKVAATFVGAISSEELQGVLDSVRAQ